MEYINSHSKLYDTIQEMQNTKWYYIWKNRQFPKKLAKGDIIYWYETTTQKLRYKAEVSYVERGGFADIKLLIKNNPKKFWDEKYNNKVKAQKGYYVSYKIKNVIAINKTPSKNYKPNRWGWNPAIGNILNTPKEYFQVESENFLYKYKSPKRIRKILESWNRNDRGIVGILKKAVNYKCEYPECIAEIKTRKGTNYVEVAHIMPFSKGGKSIAENLLVLCPNHHKEFDLGDRKSISFKDTKLQGNLNGNPFEINFDKRNF